MRNSRSGNVSPFGAPQRAVPRVLLGQKALVTGANSGTGQAAAIALGQAGADVVVNYVTDKELAQAVAETIRRSGAKAYSHRADVSQEVEDMFHLMFERFGTIDILVNNAGVQRDAAFDKMTLAQWHTVIGVNLTGPLLCARAVVCEFLRPGVSPAVSWAAGEIICLSSVQEVIPWAGHANSAASKAGVMMMMKSLAQEVAPHRIWVNSVAPGAIRTPSTLSAWNTQAAYDQLMTLIPYKRIGEPEDVARASVWLASDDSGYVLGTTLFVDGGMTRIPIPLEADQEKGGFYLAGFARDNIWWYRAECMTALLSIARLQPTNPKVHGLFHASPRLRAQVHDRREASWLVFRRSRHQRRSL
jgi:glucose 1-dehydrogenase